MLRPVTLAVLAASVAHAAPGLRGKDTVWFPTREGDTRVYEDRVGDKAEPSHTEVVTKVEKKDGAVRVTIRRDFPRAAGYTTTIAVSGDGLIQVALNGEALAKPSMLLKTPLKAGTKWESNAGGRYEATKEEEVEVPAGRFRAVRVELVQGDRKMTLWFAPGVGQIKTVEAGSDRVHVLKEFKPGK